jgi:7-alpha-hydroxysteroid dehydrogenase
MAADLGPKIRVNGITPGPVETPALVKIMQEKPEVREAAMRATRMRRFAKPEEIGYAALYLCSPAAAFVTGSILPVNGGEVEEQRGTPDL